MSTKTRWQTYSLAFQLGNVGSEVNRMLSWLDKGEKLQAEKSLMRALELLDLTITDQRWALRRGELLRLREILCSKLFAPDRYQISNQQLIDYFLRFGILARKAK